MACAEPVLPRLTSATSTAGRYEGFWEINLNPWTPPPACSSSKKPAAASPIFLAAHFRLPATKPSLPTATSTCELLAEFQAIFAGRGLDAPPSPVAYAKEREP